MRDDPVDADLFDQRVAEAFDLRRRFCPPETDAYRLLHGEGDRLPGVVVDRYGAHAVLRYDGEATAAHHETWVEILWPRLQALGVGTLLARRGRGKDKRVDLLHGDPPEGRQEVRERGMTLLVDLLEGQKTGMFVDHRESRHAVRGLASGLRVLNLYGYTGGFSIAAGLGGARRVDTVDVAPKAIELAVQGWAHNGLDPAVHEGHAADVESFLDGARAAKRRWDLVVSDPPSFAPSESAKPAAMRAYKALHRGCLQVVAPGGLYLAASCSSHVHRDDFEQTLREAAHGARRPLQVLGRWGAGFDHPVPMGFPEGDYLTVTLCRAGI